MKKLLLILFCVILSGAYAQERKVTDLKVKGVLGFDVINTNTITAEKDTINWATGNLQTLALNDTVTLTFIAPSMRSELQLFIVHDTTTTVYPITWPATVKWAGGSAANTTERDEAVDIIKFMYDGTNYYQTGKNLDVK